MSVTESNELCRCRFVPASGEIFRSEGAACWAYKTLLLVVFLRALPGFPHHYKIENFVVFYNKINTFDGRMDGLDFGTDLAQKFCVHVAVATGCLQDLGLLLDVKIDPGEIRLHVLLVQPQDFVVTDDARVGEIENTRE